MRSPAPLSPSPEPSFDDSSLVASSSSLAIGQADSQPILDSGADEETPSLDTWVNSLQEELERRGQEADTSHFGLLFRYPPETTGGKPHLSDQKEVNSGPYSILDDYPANQSLLDYEQWLLQSILLVDSLSQEASATHRLRLVILRRVIDKEFSRLEALKEAEWHRQRRTTSPATVDIAAAGNGSLSLNGPGVVDTCGYRDPSWKNLDVVNLLLQIIGAVTMLLCRVSMAKCNWMLRALKVAFALGFEAACGKMRTFPAGQYIHQDFDHWLARLQWYPGIEAIVDRDVLDPENYTPGFYRDVWDTPTFRTLKGADGKLFIDPTVSEGRYIFGICMDGFNGEGKGGAVRPLTAVYLVWYNLPPELRFKYEHMYLAGVLCGHPSLEQINHLLRPLMSCFCRSYLHGVWFRSTPLHPSGKLSRSAIVPVVADLLAARQLAGFAPHNHTNFCSLCTQKLGDIEELDYRNWSHRSLEEHRRIAAEWRDAATEAAQDDIYDTHGIRWSELLRLPYWDPTKYVALDSMHMFYLGNFQRHCEQVWGMGGKYRDGLDGIAYDPEKKPPTSHELKNAVKILRAGSRAELAGLRTEILRTLCKDYRLRFPKKRSKLLEVLVKFRVDQGWFDDQGNLVMPDEVHSSPQSILPELPPQSAVGVDVAQPQVVTSQTESDVLRKALDTLQNGNKTALTRLPAQAVRVLCETLLAPPAEGWEALNKAALLNLIHQYRRDQRITDDQDKLLPKPPRRNTADGLGEMAVAQDTLRHGSMTQLRRLPTLLLIELSNENHISSRQPLNKTQALEQLQDYRVKEGIEREDGGLVRPRNARTRILGRDRMKLIWDDMDNTTYPSWFSPAPPRVAATGTSAGMKADQWRSYCTVHLPISLLHWWGCSQESSREYRILVNFMDLSCSPEPPYLPTSIFPFTGPMSPKESAHRMPPVASPSNTTIFFYSRFKLIIEWVSNLNIPTTTLEHHADATVDDLSGTLLRRFCMQQNLRLMINDQDLPGSLHSLALGFTTTFRSKAAMSLLAATLAPDDDHLDGFDSPAENKFQSNHLSDPEYSTPIRSQTILPEDIFPVFQEWWFNHQTGPDLQPPLPFSRMLNQVTINGAEYTTQRKRPRDSHVVITAEDEQDWQAGCIRQIFEHTQHHRSQIFLVVDCFKQLTHEHALRDPCRAFPVAGGRLFYKTLLPVPKIVKTSDVTGHFACRDRVLPSGREPASDDALESETISCIHVLPLEKVSARWH
uniref:Uncharacterized protein n=1 Tax=Ganoderma boninense TaxID=34458 RepID=A0A5K1JYT4_9APHY|nr:Uncharacterized protein [Ganoderma boninense]